MDLKEKIEARRKELSEEQEKKRAEENVKLKDVNKLAQKMFTDGERAIMVFLFCLIVWILFYEWWIALILFFLTSAYFNYRKMKYKKIILADDDPGVSNKTSI